MYLILKKPPGRSVQTRRIDLNQKYLESVRNGEVTVIRINEGSFQRLVPKARVTDTGDGLKHELLEDWRNYSSIFHS